MFLPTPGGKNMRNVQDHQQGRQLSARKIVFKNRGFSGPQLWMFIESASGEAGRRKLSLTVWQYRRRETESNGKNCLRRHQNRNRRSKASTFENRILEEAVNISGRKSLTSSSSTSTSCPASTAGNPTTRKALRPPRTPGRWWKQYWVLS